ncbi:hypothetical protein R3P38DRAFT_2850858, partial [Favolaschia claudopus]
MSDATDCCGICCLCASCCGLCSSVFRYIPFQYICRCGRKKDEEEDIDNMKFPEHESAFTADGHRIHPHTAPMQIRAFSPPLDDSPAQGRQPPDYPASVRDAIRSDSEQPMEYRPGQGGGRLSKE